MCSSGGDRVHSCKGGRPAQPQLWALALSQPEQEPQPEQQPKPQLLSTPQPRISTILAPPQPFPLPHLNILIPAVRWPKSYTPRVALYWTHCCTSLLSWLVPSLSRLLSLIFGLLFNFFYDLTVILPMTATHGVSWCSPFSPFLPRQFFFFCRLLNHDPVVSLSCILILIGSSYSSLVLYLTQGTCWNALNSCICDRLICYCFFFC